MKLHLPLLLWGSLCLSSVVHAVTVDGASGNGTAGNPYTPADTTITISGTGAQHGVNVTLGAKQTLHSADNFDEYVSGTFYLADGSSITGNVNVGANGTLVFNNTGNDRLRRQDHGYGERPNCHGHRRLERTERLGGRQFTRHDDRYRRRTDTEL